MPTKGFSVSRICDQLPQYLGVAFKIEERDENLVAIITPFIYPYGDPIVLYLTQIADQSYIVSDRGESRNWLNECKGFCLNRELSPVALAFWATECELYKTEVSESQHLQTEVNPVDIGPAAFRLIQTIIHLLGLGLPDEV